jgi:enediyne biosynthesis protein E4
MMASRFLPAVLFAGLLLATCRNEATGPEALQAPAVPVTVATQPLAASACEGRFVEHTLPFATGTRIREINTYESNGAGVALGDLDGDRDLDLVFASIDREAEIFWNEGDLNFTPEPLQAMFTRAVNIVDVDGDSHLDIVFTHRGLEPPSYWRNDRAEGRPHFTAEALTGVDAYAYSMAWGDLGGDGALDLVVGSYNVDLKQQGIDAPEQDARAGVHYYKRQGDGFGAQLLSPQAQALAVGLVNLNDDQLLDIWVANDFVQQDGFWLRDPTATSAWRATRPFQQTSHSTMSIDWGDVANGGQFAFLTTDMNAEDISVETTAAWLPVIAKLEQPHGANDPQIMANVLQMPAGRGEWRNRAARTGIDATGWSWAGKFGDLDNDGWLDLYIVNGMIAQNLFGHLPNGELVEANQAFQNQGGGTFEPAPQWGLGSLASGRGMMMGDLDNDGDLDIVINNLRSSAQLFENRICGGASLQVDLRWAGTPNPFALGAHLRLQTDRGEYLRDVRASSGYLSGDPARVHFGLPAGETLEALEIRWPDGAVSRVDDLMQNQLVEVTR